MSPSLTLRKVGASASYMRGRVGKSPLHVARDADMRARTVQRAFDVQRIPRGLVLYGTGGKPTPIDFDPDGRIQVVSADDSVTLTRPFGRHYALDLSVPGCECCPENITWEVKGVSDDPGCFSVVWDTETCNWCLLINYECLAVYFGGG